MTSADAQYFWANHPGRGAWCQTYADTYADASRDWVIDAVQTFDGADTVLDLGCHCGPLLLRLNDLGYSTLGVDINALAVGQAQAAGLNAIVGTIPAALQRLPAHAFDVVVSSYALAYIAPSDLDHTMQAILRVARLGVVLLEPTVEPTTPSVLYKTYTGTSYCEWAHSYMDSLDRVVTGPMAGQVVAGISLARMPHEDLNGRTVARLSWS